MRIDGISAEIDLIRSSRRSLAAEIRPDGSVLVRAPQRMPMHVIEAFLREKSAVIEKHVQRRQAQYGAIGQIRPFSAAEIRDMAQRAADVIPKRVQYYAAVIGVTYGRITVRKQKTRWGSCTAAGNLNFNCLLMRAPPEVLDSVVVHELCHRLHPNHSERFYAAVYRAFPEYDRCRAWLKEHGPVLMLRAAGSTSAPAAEDGSCP